MWVWKAVSFVTLVLLWISYRGGLDISHPPEGLRSEASPKFSSVHIQLAPVNSVMAAGSKHKAINKILKPFMGIHYGPDLTSTSHKNFLIAFKL